MPLFTRLRFNLREQLCQNLIDMCLDRHMRLFDFTQLRAVNIHVDDFRIRAELFGFTNRPVIKTCAKNNQ